MTIFPRSNLDWSTAVKDGKVLLYSNASDDAVRPLLSKDYSSIDDLNQDILSTAQNLQSSTNMHIPVMRKRPQHTQKVHDRMIYLICVGRVGVLLEDGKRLADPEVVSFMMIGESVKEMYSNT